MKALFRDVKRALAKTLRPKKEPKPTKVSGVGWTQQRGQPYRPQGRSRR